LAGASSVWSLAKLATCPALRLAPVKQTDTIAPLETTIARRRCPLDRPFATPSQTLLHTPLSLQQVEGLRRPEQQDRRLMGQSHHHHIDPTAGDARLLWAIAVNVMLTLAQIVGGLVSGSLALVADAVHNLSDAASLGITLAARKIARQPMQPSMSFGYGRTEVVAALVNYTALILIGVYLAWEAAWRFVDPAPVGGWVVVIVAGAALLVDAVTALLTWRMAKESVNIRAAFIHNLADAGGSVAVIVSGVLILLFDWWIVDPIITLGIAGYILWMAVSEMPPVIRMLMLASPAGLSPEAVHAAAQDVPGVQAIHNAQLWQMQEHQPAFQAHVVIRAGDWTRADAIKQLIKARLNHEFGIAYSVLELECAAHACADAPRFGQS
jgi:cobalt-zinc-cadmium efflux system protein